jgi:hypothetical protein
MKFFTNERIRIGRIASEDLSLYKQASERARPAMSEGVWAKAILTQIGRDSGVFEVIVTEDTSEFSTENLERYAAVMFYTTGELRKREADTLASEFE